MRKLSAAYIFPVSSPPIKEGIVLINDKGIITDVIDPAYLDYSLSDVEKHDGYICPGFVNAHCHLELSYLHRKMKEGEGLNKFITTLEQVRKDANKESIAEAIALAEKEMFDNGIVAAGDICNNSSTIDVKQNSKIHFHSFIEAFASNPLKADVTFNKALELFQMFNCNDTNKAVSITPHAPYSLSKNLFLLLKSFAEQSGNILSIHHQESENENRFFNSAHGNLVEMQQRFGVEKSDFSNSGLRPLAAIADYLPKNNPLQLVHNTVSTEADIAFAQQTFPNLYWCFCPNANLYIEKKLPDFALFFNQKCKITIGTDSLASNHSLSILGELKTIRNNMPFIPLHTLLTWATKNGSEFLQIADRLGTLEKGKTPGILLLENVNKEKTQITRNTTVKVLA